LSAAASSTKRKATLAAPHQDMRALLACPLELTGRLAPSTSLRIEERKGPSQAELRPMGGWLPLADAVSSIQNFVHVFILVYVLVLFAYILLSWVKLPYSPWLNRIQRFLFDVSEPYLRIFRRFLPPFGAFDLSPMIAIFSLFILDFVIQSILDRFH
jgi:YggT family protein